MKAGCIRTADHGIIAGVFLQLSARTLESKDIDVCARLARYVDEHVARGDFITSIYPEPEYNSPSDWDDVKVPYNHMYKRYLTIENADIASMPASAVWPCKKWYESKQRGRGPTEENDEDHDLLIRLHDIDHQTMILAWYFLKRLSHDIGVFSCISMCNGDRERAEAMFARFKDLKRKGSAFWLTCADEEKTALMSWQEPLA